jgi:hypothetical protein
MNSANTAKGYLLGWRYGYSLDKQGLNQSLLNSGTHYMFVTSTKPVSINGKSEKIRIKNNLE